MTDEGAGFVVADALRDRGHLGLRGMRDRVAEIRGELSLESSPGHGARVKVAVPARLTILDRL